MPGPYTLGQIVSRLGGRVAGDGETRIHQVGSLERATAGQVTFFSNRKLHAKLAETRAAAVILSAENEALSKLPRIVADNPYAYFARVSQLFNPVVGQPAGVHASAVVSSSARLGRNVSIGAGCVVGDDVVIGDDSCLYPRVVVYPGCKIGSRVVIHAGAVIGADGFGIAPEAGKWVKIPQIGGVRIGNDVEIGASTTIDRGAIEDTVIAGCTGISGSTTIGARCMIAGQVGIAGHLTICDDVFVTGRSFVNSSIRKPGYYSSGIPVDATPRFRKNAARFQRLDELARQVRRLAGAGDQPQDPQPDSEPDDTEQR